MIYRFFDRKSGSSAVNEVLDQELHKSMVKKCKTRNLYARFKDNIWDEMLNIYYVS